MSVARPSAVDDPHAGGPVRAAGAPLARARLAVLMLHGRGAGAADMLGLAQMFAMPDIAYLAPEAAGASWWPQSFLAPLEANEPAVSSALKVVERGLDDLAEAGFGPDRVVLIGFSQGACLALEAAARTGRRTRGVVALSGGLVGTSDASEPATSELYGHRPKAFDYEARHDGMIVFIGCHERDPHIPLARVKASRDVFERLGAAVTMEVFPGSGHGIVDSELRFIRGLLNA